MVSSSVHQILGQPDTMIKCLYCGTQFNEKNWESDHHLKKHYKINTCENCGKSIKVQVDFEGSGDDNWGSPMEFDDNIKIQKSRAEIIPVESPLEKAVKAHIEKRNKGNK